MGPIKLKSSGGEKKIWVCLYTCLVVRAIHLDIVHNLTSDQFLLSFRRLIARRGVPLEVISDNATQFVMSSTIMRDYLVSNDINWKFTTPLAPWQGGVYERLIGITKNCLEKSLDYMCYDESEVTTTLLEVESVINNRPLTYVDEDSVIQPIAPNDFLILNPRRNGIELKKPSEMDIDDMDKSRTEIIKNWRRGNRILTKFWNLWKTEYLYSLRERYATSIPNPRSVSKMIPKIGDVVLVQNDLPMKKWKLARISELVRSTDGEIRSAVIQDADKKYFKRSLIQLYPLELEN